MFSLLKKCTTRIFVINKHANLVEMFKPMYILLSCMGLFPYTITFPTKDVPTVTPKSLVGRSICASLVSSSMCLFLGHIIYNFYSQVVLGEISKVVQINFTIELSMLLTSGIIAYFYSFKNRKIHVAILSEIATMWTKLHGIQVRRILEYYRLQVNCLALSWLVMFVAAHVTVLFAPNRMFIMIASKLVPEVVSTAAVGFYYVLVLMVICILKNIELCCRRFVQPKGFVGEVFNGEHVLKSIGKMELCYMETMEIKERINRVCAAPALLVLVQVYHSTLRQAHALCFALGATPVLWQHVVIRTLWTLYPLSKIYALTFTGTVLKHEVTKIGQTLHDIPSQNRETFMKIQHFTSMLYYYVPELSIYGFFLLDANLLFSMITSVAAYLVVLIQFGE